MARAASQPPGTPDGAVLVSSGSSDGAVLVSPESPDGATADSSEVDSREAAPTGLSAVVARVQRVLAWWNGTRIGRSLSRYGQVNGGLLCGGIAYSALFSVFAGLTIGFTVFTAVLGRNEALRDSVLDAVDGALPGLVRTGDRDGIVDPDQLGLSAGLSIASIVAAVVLLFSAISCMSAIRSGVRAMFGLTGSSHAVGDKLRALAGLVGVGLALLLSAVSGLVLSGLSRWLTGLLGIEETKRVLLQGLGFVVTVGVDLALFVLIVVLLCGLRPARRDLLLGGLLAAVAWGAVRIAGTSVVAGGADSNPLLASFAVLVTLLVWMNLFARILLTAAAFTADPSLEEVRHQLVSEDQAAPVPGGVAPAGG